jgi:hypothetical protein
VGIKKPLTKSAALSALLYICFFKAAFFLRFILFVVTGHTPSHHAQQGQHPVVLALHLPVILTVYRQVSRANMK